MEKISFASDNCSAVDKRIMNAIASVNTGSAQPYGADPHTKKAIELIKKEFGNDPDVYFVYNGTASNVISLKGCLRSFEAVIATDISHLDEDECGAPESICGTKILLVKNSDGKLKIKDIERFMSFRGSLHQVQPKLISIAQSTEFGTVYTTDEINEICSFAHKNDLLVHVDGARIANACASLDTSLKKMISDTGVDILSLGVSKNGGMFGDAIVVFDETIKKDFRFLIKNSINLHSKNRFIAVQFIEFFKDGLFYENAKKANQNMSELIKLLKKTKIEFSFSPQANTLFVKLKKEAYEQLSKKYFFYNIHDDMYRIMTSFETTMEEITAFAEDISKSVK